MGFVSDLLLTWYYIQHRNQMDLTNNEGIERPECITLFTEVASKLSYLPKTSTMALQ